MSLLSENMKDFAFIERRSVPDGEGGFTFGYVEGATFKAHARLDTSTTAEIAAAQGVKSLYTIITSRDINLQVKDVVRRLEDGKYFRVTSDGDDKKTPNGAGLDIRLVRAEEWELPHD